MAEPARLVPQRLRVPVTTIAEHLAWEAKLPVELITGTSQRRWPVFLRDALIWLANVWEQHRVDAIAASLGRQPTFIYASLRRSTRMHREDAEFRDLVSLVAGALPRSSDPYARYL